MNPKHPAGPPMTRGNMRESRAPRLRQVFTHLREQRARTVGLADVGAATCRPCFGLIASQGVGGHRDDRNRLHVRIGFDASGGLVAVHDW